MITKRELYNKYIAKSLTISDIEENAKDVRFDMEFLLRPRKMNEQVFNDIMHSSGLIYYHEVLNKN